LLTIGEEFVPITCGKARLKISQVLANDLVHEVAKQSAVFDGGGKQRLIGCFSVAGNHDLQQFARRWFQPIPQQARLSPGTRWTTFLKLVVYVDEALPVGLGCALEDQFSYFSAFSYQERTGTHLSVVERNCHVDADFKDSGGLKVGAYSEYWPEIPRSWATSSLISSKPESVTTICARLI
jgi:hypothetical protein